MRTVEYLFGPPALAAMFWPAVVVGLLVAVLCAALSPVVVLKRMSFIGQGVSHAAFGGVGLAMALGLGADWRMVAVVALACVGAALGIASLSDRKGVNADTAIGIVLVTAMAAGFVLIQHASEAMRDAALRTGEPVQPVAVEALLFGSVFGVRWGDAVLAAAVVVAEMAALWVWRRGLLFWAFDEVGAASCGVRVGAARTILLVMLALAIVVTMRLAGVVLATALLVLPGATALRCSARWWTVVGLSVGYGLAGVAAGLVVSFELDWQPGPAIVLVQVAGYALVRVVGGLARPGTGGPGG